MTEKNPGVSCFLPWALTPKMEPEYILLHLLPSASLQLPTCIIPTLLVKPPHVLQLQEALFPRLFVGVSCTRSSQTACQLSGLWRLFPWNGHVAA